MKKIKTTILIATAVTAGLIWLMYVVSIGYQM